MEYRRLRVLAAMLQLDGRRGIACINDKHVVATRHGDGSVGDGSNCLDLARLRGWHG
jgi:hypothetical protein